MPLRKRREGGEPDADEGERRDYDSLRRLSYLYDFRPRDDGVAAPFDVA